MKNLALLIVHFFFAAVLFAAACSGNPQSKLKGNWQAKDGTTHLTVTDDEFIVDNDSSASEDYILKGDTIYTSYKGNQPYTKYVIEHLDDHELKLLYPDSVSVEFSR
ncbi:hypothetical protein [Mucilaginibacter agri]|uniref:DUF5640 domain-containing protein n=1 Tax=Mucilaginibacter agri TaxID=2695265 RepID=A0A965ZKH9_9SPHI|nr:hypothetical protein [Mucilaginibacter agri]NCD71609.1 hypothetical protein [Mucilaginibacter agri]